MTILRPFACVTFLFAVLVGTSANAEPLKIRIDWSVIPGQFAPIIASLPKYAPDVYRHYGKSYVVEPIRLKGGGATLIALAAGETDISTLAPPNLALGVTEAKLDLRVIGSQIATEVPGYLYTHFWVNTDKIKKVADLRGKVVAVNARGSNIDAAARMVLERSNIRQPRDYQVVEIRFPAMVAALESGRVDAAPMVPPFNLMAERNPKLKPLFSVHDAFGAVETLMFITKAEFVKKNRAALVDFLEDNIRLRRWMFDPETRKIAIKQLHDLTKIPESAYASWVYTNKDYYYHPKALLDVDRLQENVNTMKKAGLIKTAIEVKPYVDLSLAKEAAARIKD